MSLDLALTASAVGAAAVWLLRRLRRSVRVRRDGRGCGGGCGCASAKPGAGRG